MKEAKEFLDMCRRRFPSPRQNQRHSLTLEGDTLVLTLMQGDTYQRFNLEGEDMQKAPAQLLAELIAIMKNPPRRPKPPKLPPEGPKPAA